MNRLLKSSKFMVILIGAVAVAVLYGVLVPDSLSANDKAALFKTLAYGIFGLVALYIGGTTLEDMARRLKGINLLDAGREIFSLYNDVKKKKGTEIEKDLSALFENVMTALSGGEKGDETAKTDNPFSSWKPEHLGITDGAGRFHVYTELPPKTLGELMKLPKVQAMISPVELVKVKTILENAGKEAGSDAS